MIDSGQGLKFMYSFQTIFEVGVTTHQNCAKVMKAKRGKDERVIERAAAKRKADELEEGGDDGKLMEENRKFNI